MALLFLNKPQARCKLPEETAKMIEMNKKWHRKPIAGFTINFEMFICNMIERTYRKYNMKTMTSIYLLSATVFCISSCGTQKQLEKEIENRPNIIYINVDDLGWKDVGFMGGNYFETPNIDKLANEAMVFTQSYAGAANCAPSRACLMTGQNTPRHGVYTVNPSARGNVKDRKLIPILNTDSLNSNVVTMAEMFREAGYSTGTFGKWHLGHDPTTQGFDVNVGGDFRGNPGKGGYFSPYNVAHLKDGPEGEHLTDRLTTEAIAFLNKNKEKPFFLYLPFYSVHTPILARKELIEKYKAKDNPLGINPTYGAMVETVDTNIGRLLKEVANLGITENTLIVFTSDNGGIRSIATQAPLRAGKGSYYEGGTRVPCIIRWPGVTIPGSQSEVPIVNLDFYPTFMEILDLSFPNKLLDGQSLVPLLKGKYLEKRPLYWHFPIYLESYNQQKDDGRDPLFRTRPGSTILYDDWKLHLYFEDQGTELYYLPDDPGERINLASENQEKANELLGMLRDWHNEVNAPIPAILNPDYEPL